MKTLPLTEAVLGARYVTDPACFLPRRSAFSGAQSPSEDQCRPSSPFQSSVRRNSSTRIGSARVKSKKNAPDGRKKGRKVRPLGHRIEWLHTPSTVTSSKDAVGRRLAGGSAGPPCALEERQTSTIIILLTPACRFGCASLVQSGGRPCLAAFNLRLRVDRLASRFWPDTWQPTGPFAAPFSLPERPDLTPPPCREVLC